MGRSKLLSFPSPITALVVGASRGIGLGFVRSLKEDANVERLVAACRTPGNAPELKQIADSSDKPLKLIALDITEEDSVAAAAKEVSGGIQHLDLLINCAGVLHDGDGLSPERRIGELEPAKLMRSFEVHALGPALLAKHFAPMFERNARAIFASLSARVGSIGDNRLGGWYSYRASKAAHNMILRNLSIELRRRHRGIICVSLHPGTVDTDLSRPFQQGVPAERLFSIDRAVDQLLAVVDGLEPDSNGRFYAWDGQEIPW